MNNKNIWLMILVLGIWSCKKTATTDPTPQPLHLEIGQFYQGGYITYIDTTGQHGLIISKEISKTYPWCAQFMLCDSIGGTKTGMGTGSANTIIIVSHKKDTGYNAADICNNFESNGYNDWYLPSRDELRQVYIHRSQLGSLGGEYWSSTEKGKYLADYIDFSNGTTYTFDKDHKCSVLPVRSF
jgi:hypothetical protein